MSSGSPLTAGQLARRSIEIVNTGRADLAAEVCGEDFVTVDPHGHDHSPAEVESGPQVFAAVVGYLHQTFEDLHMDVLESYGEGDRAATVIRLTGRYIGSSRGPGRGQPVSVEQVHFWLARDGKIVHHRFLDDDVEFSRQLGQVPAAGGGGTVDGRAGGQ